MLTVHRLCHFEEIILRCNVKKLSYTTILFYYIHSRIHIQYKDNVLYKKDYTRIIQEDIVTLPVGIREGIIRGNGYVLNMKY